MYKDLNTFGSIMPGREYTAQSVAGYRFGFNGVEKENEINGAGNIMDYGARVYDSRFGRFFSKDPWENKFPSFSTYSFSKNSPILMSDLNGKGAKVEIIAKTGDMERPRIKVSSVIYIYSVNSEVQSDITNLASSYQTHLNQSWNNAGSNHLLIEGEKPIPARVKIGTIEYDVDFNFVVKNVTYDEAQKLFLSNKERGGVDNFVALDKGNSTTESLGNVGIWNVDAIKADNSVLDDEIGHFLAYRPLPPKQINPKDNTARSFHNYSTFTFKPGMVICAMCRDKYGKYNPSEVKRKPLVSDVKGLNYGSGFNLNQKTIGEVNSSSLIKDFKSYTKKDESDINSKSQQEVLNDEVKPKRR